MSNFSATDSLHILLYFLLYFFFKVAVNCCWDACTGKWFFLYRDFLVILWPRIYISVCALTLSNWHSHTDEQSFMLIPVLKMRHQEGCLGLVLCSRTLGHVVQGKNRSFLKTQDECFNNPGTSAAGLDRIYMPKCTELLWCDWLIFMLTSGGTGVCREVV